MPRGLFPNVTVNVSEAADAGVDVAVLCSVTACYFNENSSPSRHNLRTDLDTA